jgi:hypothetical protein
VKARQISANLDFGQIRQVEHGVLYNKRHADPLDDMQGGRLFLLMKGI